MYKGSLFCREPICLAGIHSLLFLNPNEAFAAHRPYFPESPPFNWHLFNPTPPSLKTIGRTPTSQARHIALDLIAVLCYFIAIRSQVPRASDVVASLSAHSREATLIYSFLLSNLHLHKTDPVVSFTVSQQGPSVYSKYRLRYITPMKFAL